MNIEDRYDCVQDNSYVNKLHEIAKSNNIKYDECETISWLDSQSIMLKVINKMEKFDYDNLLNNMRIIQEFHIPFTNKRADYSLIYENKIIIVEFSYNKFDNEDYHYNIKLNQLIGHKELIINILSKNIDIGTFTFLIHPEDVDENSNLYILTNPKICGLQNTEIENLFTEETLKTNINGKTLSLKNDYNVDKYYGKEIFSKFILKNYSTIDFSNFVPMLDALNNIVLNYNKNN